MPGMDKRTSSAGIGLAIAFLLLPLLYIGSYLVLVEPLTVDGRQVYRPAWDEHSNDQYSRLYWPLEKTDGMVRPATWDKRHLTPIEEFRYDPWRWHW
jgi:hypothetical protein